ncbi:Fe-S protein, radical SAM family [Candidatus Koribacter versatilis Ellin345]|uniref:Fe-S protein, radical SAM family n=1 Tax=Koribacter versatilis (strain Ellin345) TaxID=204669 RepID=Q1IVB9_KORVE|nr:radical SAM protein [Candidatus Koribacter versatilis]ABF39181.1 Fe-S protein, radical SAM family [Candidatus Koribacter versatilis Ellin345]
MQIQPILQTWGRVLTGRVPNLSIEITRECPLRCPGCYAYEDNHLGGDTNLRSLTDYKGDDLVRRVLSLVDEHKPLHLSIVGGDPLVRYRELEIVLPQLAERGIHVQVVTSAFRPIPTQWATLPRLRMTVSIDGLQPEHDLRRKPATYERVLRNIEGQHVAVHCTITGAMVRRAEYLRGFLDFWSENPNAEKIWFSIFTPQIGADSVECITADERTRVIQTLLDLRESYPKLDMPEGMLKAFLAPPHSPEKCVFARTTRTISADFKTHVEPCQLGGAPDCSRCGCIASMGLSAIGNHKLLGPLTAGSIFFASASIGDAFKRSRNRKLPEHPSPKTDTELITIDQNPKREVA